VGCNVAAQGGKRAGIMPFGSHRQSLGAHSCFAHGVSEDGGSLPALAANLAEGEKGTAPAPGSRRLRWRAWHGESRASRVLRNGPDQVPKEMLTAAIRAYYARTAISLKDQRSNTVKGSCSDADEDLLSMMNRRAVVPSASALALVSSSRIRGKRCSSGAPVCSE
jgi:hypothetical protein